MTRKRSSRVRDSSGIRPSSCATPGLTSWSFDHLVATQQPFARFHRELHSSPLVDLASGHDAYLADVRARSKDVLAQVARRRRKLGREVGDVVVEWQTHDAAALDTLFAWKSAQYRETGVWDRFDQPWIVDVVRALAATSSDRLTGLLSTLRAGEHVVAVHFGLLGRDRLVWWFPAYDADFGSYSPGLILLLDLVAEAAARGLTLVDLGPRRAPLQAPGGERCLRRRRRHRCRRRGDVERQSVIPPIATMCEGRTRTSISSGAAFLRPNSSARSAPM